MDSNSGLQPSYRGFVETAGDAQSLIEACLRGSLPLIRSRPVTSERPTLVQSGHIFIFEEAASGIKRWTDGKRWTPSRALDGFLVYGELQPAGRQSRIIKTGNQSVLVNEGLEGRYDQLYGPLAKSFNTHPEDLVKKTIRLKYLNHTWHVVSYYRPVEVLEDRLKRPFIDQDNQENQDIVQMLHVDGSHLPLGDLSLSYRTGEHSGPSRLCPWNTGASALTENGADCAACTGLEPDHCNVQQNLLPDPGVWDMEVMPDSIMANETHQQGLNLESSWPVVPRDFEGRREL
ncbi:hypothetical protein LTR84_012405 [Exophiala bonariae]|uniref:Gti1/Pac2 family-domain-containing protein n=1 Tax=Exophiala bonariae TaxID=1690606 RepID=A0AAV9MUX0_9EURO|nr:hypothetical protein LTR84_012405 [Exophiala bonariae]